MSKDLTGTRSNSTLAKPPPDRERRKRRTFVISNATKERDPLAICVSGTLRVVGAHRIAVRRVPEDVVEFHAVPEAKEPPGTAPCRTCRRRRRRRRPCRFTCHRRCEPAPCRGCWNCWHGRRRKRCGQRCSRRPSGHRCSEEAGRSNGGERKRDHPLVVRVVKDLVVRVGVPQ